MTTDAIPPRLVERIARMMSERKTGHVRIDFRDGQLMKWETTESESGRATKRQGAG